jgi:hypothetical protein
MSLPPPVVTAPGRGAGGRSRRSGSWGPPSPFAGGSVTDEGGKRRQPAGGAHPQGERQSEPELPRAACAQPGGADTPAVGTRRSRHERRRTPWPPDTDRPTRATRTPSQRRAVCPSATGHRTEGTGGLGATGGLDRPYASALERPAPRKTAPPSSISSPRRRARAGVSPPRRGARGQGARGLPAYRRRRPGPGRRVRTGEPR